MPADPINKEELASPSKSSGSSLRRKNVRVIQREKRAAKNKNERGRQI